MLIVKREPARVRRLSTCRHRHCIVGDDVVLERNRPIKSGNIQYLDCDAVNVYIIERIARDEAAAHAADVAGVPIGIKIGQEARPRSLDLVSGDDHSSEVHIVGQIGEAREVQRHVAHAGDAIVLNSPALGADALNAFLLQHRCKCVGAGVPAIDPVISDCEIAASDVPDMIRMALAHLHPIVADGVV